VSSRLVNISSGEASELQGVCMIGRNPDCTLQIADPGVSRRHAMIREQNDGFWFFDLGSFNGSYVNGRRVTTAVKLRNNDVIELIEHQFRFEKGAEARDSTLIAMDASTLARVKNGDAILLVSDIQGFTTLSERLDPARLAPIIGSWYSKTEGILTRFGATLDKFIGDSVFAYWTDISIPTRIAAMNAVGELQKSSLETHETHREALEPLGLRFATGAALHVGRVAYGGMSAREFTLLGDAVNLAFRIEALTRRLERPVIVSSEFLEGWPKGGTYCAPLGQHEVKGRQQPVEVFAVERIPGMTA